MHTYNKLSLIFVHGNSSSAEVFTHAMNEFSLDEFDCHAIDLPGHGHNSVVPTSVGSFVDYLTFYIREHNIKNYVLIGHSLGGHICIQALSQLNPKGVLIFGTPPLSKPLPTDAFLPVVPLNCYFQEIVSEEELTALGKFCFEDRASQEELKDHFRQTNPLVRSTITRCMGELAFQDEVEVLSRTETHVLIIKCEQDQFINSAYIDRLAAGSLGINASFGAWKTDHFPHITAPPYFASKVAHFAHTVSSELTRTSTSFNPMETYFHV